MATNEIGEKVYYSDDASKVTNVRVTCNHITVPVEKIESVDVNFRIEAFSFSALVFLASFTPFLFLNFVSEEFLPAFIVLGAMIVIAAFLWMLMIYKNYIELIVAVGGHGLVILSASMKRKDMICKVALAIGDAISDEKKFQSMKKSGEVEQISELNSSETVRLKLMLEDYEKLKALKEESGKGKNA